MAQERLQGQHRFPQELGAIHQHEVGGEALQKGHRLRSIDGIGMQQRHGGRNGGFLPLGAEQAILQGAAQPFKGRQGPPRLDLPQQGPRIAVALQPGQAALSGGGGRMLQHHPHQIEHLTGPLHQPALVEAVAAEHHNPGGWGATPRGRALRGSGI